MLIAKVLALVLRIHYVFTVAVGGGVIRLLALLVLDLVLILSCSYTAMTLIRFCSCSSLMTIIFVTK